jgi:UDP:flavonoid glycosyltransferase YjiC (YdhE family)
VAEWLTENGWEVHLGVSASRLDWTTMHWNRCHPVREIWEPSGISHPCYEWFSDADYIEACVCSQEALIQRLKPDLVVGIFDYISGISTAGRLRVSINGACMLPNFQGILGFDDIESPVRIRQKKLLEKFWEATARVFHPAQKARGQSLCRLPADLLCGDVDLIYELPEIYPYDCRGEGFMIGPLFWQGWEQVGECVPWRREEDIQTIYVNAGAFPKDGNLLRVIVDECLRRGTRVLLSGPRSAERAPCDRLYYRPCLAPSSATSAANLVICTGGVGVCYANLRFGVPSLVIPMQPEQATNGIHLQRAECGKSVTTNLAYIGRAGEYAEAFNRDEFTQALDSALERPEQFAGLGRIAEAVKACDTRTLFLKKIGRCT